MALKNNTWKLNQWYDQNVAGNVSYSGIIGLWAVGGANAYGQLGQNNTTEYSSPIQVGSDTTWSTDDGKFSVMDYNESSVAAIKTDGTLWTWGKSDTGSLGQNNNTSYSSPAQIPGSWSNVDARFLTMAAVKTDGTLWAWGEGNDGQLAQNSRTDYGSPRQIPGTTWSTIHASGVTMLATKTDGTLWAQ